MKLVEEEFYLIFDDIHGGTQESDLLWKLHFKDGGVLDNTQCDTPEFFPEEHRLRIRWQTAKGIVEVSVRGEQGLFYRSLSIKSSIGLVCAEYPILGTGEDAHGTLYLPCAAKSLAEDELAQTASTGILVNAQ